MAWGAWQRPSMKTPVLTLSRTTFLICMLTVWGCGARPEPGAVVSTNRADPGGPAPGRIREPAVAGLFYPADEARLSKTVEDLLKNAPEHSIPRLKGLVCPHAGYEYSGKTAAIAYKTLTGRDVETVVVMGPSHYAYLKSAEVPNAEGYRTPLGVVPISEKAKALSGGKDSSEVFTLERPCLVQRPPWAGQEMRPMPPAGQDTPETWEHSVEVQVPYLQKALKTFKLLPVVVGEADPERLAKALAAVMDDKTVFIASSDLSHYHPYSAAKELDSGCVKAICDGNIDQMKTEEACGKVPILALMQLARLNGWKAQLLDYRNSGDATGEKDRVVGYTAIAFYAPGPQGLAEPERKLLLSLARRSLKNSAANQHFSSVDLQDIPPKLAEKKACFVTLTKGGVLRGCIGHLTALEPLYQAVIDNARNAGTRDPRFPAVQPEEVDKIKIEISVLTEPQPLPFSSPADLLAKLHPREDGVLLQIGGRTATFLPQVWAQIPDKAVFLDHLAQKAGCDASAWKGAEVAVSIYHVESFEEADGHEKLK